MLNVSIIYVELLSLVFMQSNTYTIFYADDDIDDQDFFREIVSGINEDFLIYTQNNGDELLEILKNPPPNPNLIFLDLNMPQKNGYDVLKQIRASEHTKQLPVIIFSTSNDEKAISKTKELGANLYITKPNSYTDFKKVMNSVLSLNWHLNLPVSKNFVFTSN